MKDIPLRPMTIGDILDSSIQLYKENFLKFIGIVILPQIPFLMIAAAAMPFAFKLSPRIGSLASQVVAGLIAILILPFAIAAGTRAISERFLGRNLSISEAYKHMLKRLMPLMWTTCLFSIFLTLACIPAFFASFIISFSIFNAFGNAATLRPAIIILSMMGTAVPAIFLIIRYCLITQAVIIEGESGTGALKRSKELIKDHFWRAFSVIGLLYTATLTFDIAVSLLLTMASSMLTNAPLFSALISMASAPSLSIVETFIMISMTLFYYDLRIRKEGFDLEIMAEELANENA